MSNMPVPTTPFPTPTAWVSCPTCVAQVPCYDPAGSRYFACFKCRTYFKADPTASAQPATRLDSFKKEIPPGPSLPLGAVGELGGYRCRITGYQVRTEKQDRKAVWREYQLRPAEPLPISEDSLSFPLQLAEYEGHWLLIRQAREFPTTENPRTEGAREWTDASGREFRLWHRYKPVVSDAQGEFDWNIVDDEALSIAEYTSPPYLLASEQFSHSSPTWYLAEHLEPRQVAEAFRLQPASLPVRQGIGAAQPGSIPGWPHLRRLAVAAVAILVLLQGLLLLLRAPTELLKQDFTATEAQGASKILVSNAFTIDGPAALAVELRVPSLDNHWVEVTASLVNEETGRGYEFTRSVEYYHGYEGGENWSEGGTSVSAVLSGVPSGRYHFNLYPTLDSGVGTATLGLHVEQHTPLWQNFWLALLGLTVVPLLLRWRHNSFERERWENSDFSPYSS